MGVGCVCSPKVQVMLGQSASVHKYTEEVEMLMVLVVVG